MTPVFLTKVKTRDGVTLDGIYVKPKRKGDVALVWLHGLTSRFYSGQTLIKEISSRCRKNNIGYFKFNTRGHDIAVRGPHKLLGAGFERFEDCIYDMRAVFNFARRLGYKKFILAGHSTGANKILYYIYKTADRKVAGLILLGPLSDIAVEKKRLGEKRLKAAILLAQKISKKDRGALMPNRFGLLTAARYLSLYKAGGAEDVFPYHNLRARWKELKSIRMPTAVILGSRDEYLDRSAKNLIEVFKKNALAAESFSGIIIKGARHSFIKKEGELAKTVVNWIKRII